MRIALIGRTRMLLEAGRKLAAADHAVVIVWTSEAEPSYDVGVEDFERLAKDCGADFVCGLGIGTAQAAARLAASGAEIGVAVNWKTVIPRRTLDALPHGVLNAHAGDLPRYRGNACPNWAILMGEERVGVTIHRMSEDLDAGDVLLKRFIPLAEDTHIGDVHAQLDALVPDMFVEAVDGLAAGRLDFVPQSDDPAAILRCFPRRPEDGRIDWAEPADRVLRLVRASSRPFAGAFTTLEGERRVTVWRAERAAFRGAFLAVPGQVCLRIGNDPVVACADGMIRLTEIAVEGVNDPEAAKAALHRSLRNRLV